MVRKDWPLISSSSFCVCVYNNRRDALCVQQPLFTFKFQTWGERYIITVTILASSFLFLTFLNSHLKPLNLLVSSFPFPFSTLFAMDVRVKQEVLDPPERRQRNIDGAVTPLPPPPDSVIDLSSDSDSDGGNLDSVIASAVQLGGSPTKKRKTSYSGGVVLPVGFLSPLPPPPEAVLSLPAPEWAPPSARSARSNGGRSLSLQGSKQFWKAGDYDGAPSVGFESSTGAVFFFSSF